MDEALGRRAVQRIIITVVSITLLLGVGTLGYRLIEGMSMVDSFYMAVITISTVGFGEIDPLSPGGRLFTIGLIMGGAGLVAYTFSTTADFLISGDWRFYFEQRRRRRMLSQLSRHTIICGYGRVGRHVAAELHTQKSPFVVLDMSAEKVERVRHMGYLTLQGNAANENDLRTAGIERAASLVATASSDAENVFIVLTARAMRPDLVIVARANYDESEEKLLRAGATRVILPYRICGRRMAALLSRPGVADFLDEVMHASSLEFLIDQVELSDRSPLIGQSLGQASLRQRFGITVLAFKSPQGRIDTSPGADITLQAGGTLIALGTRDQLQALIGLAAPG